MTALLWLAALVGLFVAHGALHTAALVVFVVLTIPMLIAVAAFLGIGALVWDDLRK